MKWWAEILDEEFVEVRRKSRIFYNGKYFNYPLEAIDALGKLGVVGSAACFLSYIKALLLPSMEEKNFEDWVVNRFGRRLFNTFFKTYTEKVWGVPCDQISKDWAAQRIKGFSLWEAIKSALFPQSREGGKVKTLIDRFKYPRLGPGQLWEKVAARIESGGGEILLGRKVVKLVHAASEVTDLVCELENGELERIVADHFIVTMPLQETVLSLTPCVEPGAIEAARSLCYRDFLTVALVVEGESTFDDQWIYIHNPEVKVGRVQNFRNWSEDLVPEGGRTCLGFEYFCQEKDKTWDSSDAELVELARKECIQIGLASEAQIVRGYVVRMPKAYPLYTPDYAERIGAIKEALAPIRNLSVVGRNGMHKYNNQDHSMLTAMIAIENLSTPREIQRDPWNVNSDAEYIEGAGVDSFESGRQVPMPTKD